MQETLLRVSERAAGNTGTHQLLEAGLDVSCIIVVNRDEVTLGE